MFSDPIVMTEQPAELDLTTLYPACFDPTNPRPLKRNIQTDLFKAIDQWGELISLADDREALKAARKRLRRAAVRSLTIWREQPGYAERLVVGATRIDLHGQPAGRVKSREAKMAEPEVGYALSLTERYPLCFDPALPKPLKIGIRQDLIDAGHEPQAVHLALCRYTRLRAYQRTLIAGAVRVDLQGQPAGEVTAGEAAYAAAVVAGLASVIDLPDDAPLMPENIVPGRLELAVRFTSLPKPTTAKDGVRIGLQTDAALVVATLPAKTWKRLEKTPSTWLRWVAVLTGKLGARSELDAGSVVMLAQPTVKVFERKVT